MIKKYNQFVKEKTNENIDEDKDLGFATHDGSFGGDDSDFDEMEDEQVEEEGGDIYQSKLKEVADKLGVNAEDGKVMYNGKKIIFPSETEMYHVGSKKFKTSDEVVSFLEGDGSQEEEMNKIEQEELELKESKSYKKDINRKDNK